MGSAWCYLCSDSLEVAAESAAIVVSMLPKLPECLKEKVNTMAYAYGQAFC